MSLVLYAVSLNEEPMSQPLLGRFDERGGTLGRSDNATFTLPDPERMISRLQAQVVHGDGSYWIENVSAAIPLLHNGRPLSAGMRVMLREGDELRIGGYTLQAAFEDDETSATILRGRTGSTHREGPSSGLQPAAAPAEPATAPPGAPRGGTPAARRAPAGTALAAVSEPLWRAFLEGAGVDPALPPAAAAEALAAAGAMLRIAVAGVHRLVAMRAMAKDEMQAQMTVIQVRDNNPLKFAPDGLVALQLLLQPPARGFLPGPAALRDALIDLQSHQVGVMAGTRAALERVLDRFDPTKLDALLETRSVLDSLQPGRRRARLWDLYLEHYRAIREEAQEDFQRFFGEAFREAYEAQVRSLEAAHDAAAPAAPPAAGSEA
ncbi:MAG TPA: type VI secretion system-associated FHA domain protein TagH [Steroidobacteraceae bacterium]|nr:type VI secretion system-associated FHA domain protein TagH [Steroidobacteraceae bacterium]